MSPKSSSAPSLEPFHTQSLAVDAIHTLYVEQNGRRGGVPAVFLHGGPGGSCQEAQRQLFDPDIFHAVLFDQRGCGLSTPKGCLDDNSTDFLIADLERIRETLEIERWMLVGGSWGSTLAVAYAEAYPQRVSGMVLRAVFLGTNEEVHWAFEGAARQFRPELWHAFTELLPKAERGDPVAAWGKRMESGNAAKRRGAGWVWHDYERALSELVPENEALPDSLKAAAAREGEPSSPYFEWHYMARDFFLEPGQLLERAGRLKDIPGHIIQGRYDLLCPPATAEALAHAWGENCRLKIVPGSGHSAGEPAIASALVKAVDDMGRRLAKALPSVTICS